MAKLTLVYFVTKATDPLVHEKLGKNLFRGILPKEPFRQHAGVSDLSVPGVGKSGHFFEIFNNYFHIRDDSKPKPTYHV